MENRQELKKFDADQYYDLGLDKTVKYRTGENPVRVTPFQKGRELISQYYSKKYSTNIHFPGEDIGTDFRMYASLIDFAFEIKKHLNMARNQHGSKDFRIAFFTGAGSTHATPIIYIRENGKEGLLYADSKGINESVAEMLADGDIDVYAIEDPRQKDMYSCYTDALIFGRDATAKNPQSGDYYIQGLLSSLQSRAKKNGKYYLTKLPDELLKTSQVSKFTTAHQELGSEKIIHKHKNVDETLEQFRDRYTDKDVTIVPTEREKRIGEKEVSGVSISSYARIKGVKLADIIEIQFYINQMQNILGTPLPDPILLDFVDQSKKILQKQGYVTPNMSRKGLHEFASRYISSLHEKKTSVTSQSIYSHHKQAQKSPLTTEKHDETKKYIPGKK